MSLLKPARQGASRLRLWVRRSLRRRPAAWTVGPSLPRLYGQPGRDVFVGYYDHSPVNSATGALLCLSVPQGGRAAEDSADILVFPRDGAAPQRIATTQAWAWQLAARQRWFDSDHVIFCDRGEGGFVTRVVHAASGQEVLRAPVALFDVERQGRFGIGLDFDRLQKLRPGYGFRSRGAMSTEAAGLFRYDFAERKVTPILTLAQAASLVGTGAAAENQYFNHVSINPAGSRSLVFHIVAEKARRSIRALTLSPSGTDVQVVTEPGETPSHYVWLDDRRLLLTVADSQGWFRYIVTDDAGGARQELTAIDGGRDGHPNFDPRKLDAILFDCYPDALSERHVLYYPGEGKQVRTLASFYSPPRLQGETKCDLHPRFSPDGGSIVVDTAHTGRRQVAVFPSPVPGAN